MAEPDVSRPAGRPRVTVKIAQTLDGRIATATGHSQWISGEASLQFAHQLRATHDAVMVGIGTVLHDNPRLTVRLVDGSNPVRVVADTSVRTPLDAHVLSGAPGTTIILAGQGAPADRVAAVEARGAKVVRVPVDKEGRLDLRAGLCTLASLGVRSVMVEGGAALVTSLLRGRLVDRMVVCIAPKVVGAGLEAIGDLGIVRLSDALTFARVTVRQLGPDIIFDGTLQSDRDPRMVPACATSGRP